MQQIFSTNRTDGATMSHFDNVDSIHGKLPYMRRPQAVFLCDFVKKHNIKNILEIGFYHGKSSAYFAAILEDQGKGHLTTIDRVKRAQISPYIDEVLDAVNLSHRVTPIVAERSYTWELQRLISQIPRPQFDLCYFDGGHVWDRTGFGFFLVDMLLKPGGWIIFDDMDWKLSERIKKDGSVQSWFRDFSEDELETAAVRRVFEVLVPHLGYTNLRENQKARVGNCAKAGRPISAHEQQLAPLAGKRRPRASRQGRDAAAKVSSPATRQRGPSRRR